MHVKGSVMMQPSGRAVMRRASMGDVRTVARLDHLASQPPFDRSFYDDLLEGSGTDSLVFLEAALTLRASRWGQVEDFLLLEIDGQVAAGCAVFAPAPEGHRSGPLDPGLFPEIARKLGWSAGQTARFRSAYERMWPEPMRFLDQEANMIVEAVAVFPEFRGRHLGDHLMEAAKERARAEGARTLGVMVVQGNERAARLYARHFQPYITFHADFFDEEFPGVTHFRAVLATDDVSGETP